MPANPLLVHALIHDPKLPAAILPTKKQFDLAKEDDLNFIVTLFKEHGYLHLQHASLSPWDPEHQITENAELPVSPSKRPQKSYHKHQTYR